MPNESEQASAHAFTLEVCKGNRDAQIFCGLWYLYCHAIDDLLDTREDGRPTMSAEAILAIFAKAAMLYNTNFYVTNRSLLFPVVLMVTNQYADSVAWEKSPIERRRIMADVLRCCGDEMFFIVAMIVGGWDHVRSLSLKIRDRDYELQHDAEGNPI